MNTNDTYNGVRFRHYRHVELDRHGMPRVNPRGGATIAYEEGKLGVSGEQGYTIGVSYCNPKDNYQKQYGRAKSLGRLRQLHTQGNHTGEEDDKHLVVVASSTRELLSRVDSFMEELGLLPR